MEEDSVVKQELTGVDHRGVDWDEEHFMEVIGSSELESKTNDCSTGEQRREIKQEPDDEEPYVDVGGFLELETVVKDESAVNTEHRTSNVEEADLSPSCLSDKTDSTFRAKPPKYRHKSNQEIRRKAKKRFKKYVDEHAVPFLCPAATNVTDNKLENENCSKMFVCLLCKSCFTLNHDLYNHNISAHSTNDLSTCAFCEISFDSVVTFIAHLKSHVFLTDQCRSCLKTLRTSTKRGSSFECEECSVAINDGKTKDVSDDVDSKVICRLCSVRCVNLADLRSHMRTHRRDAIQCTICGMTFTERHTLVQHSKLHSGERPFKCDTCGQTFTRASHLKQHGNTHLGERPFECASCNKTFTLKSSLIRHMTTHRIASEEDLRDRRFMCEICGKAFKQSATLKSHLFVHSGGAKPFVCDSCDRRFARKGSLQVHKRSHAGTKRFSCGECGKAFTTKGKLTIHARNHTGARPYKCEICGKAFIQSSALKQHSWTHSGFRPLECHICNKGFIRKVRLMDHIKQCLKHAS